MTTPDLPHASDLFLRGLEKAALYLLTTHPGDGGFMTLSCEVTLLRGDGPGAPEEPTKVRICLCLEDELAEIGRVRAA
jgi:hypothetical protein